MLTNLSAKQMGLFGWVEKQTKEAKRLTEKGGK